MAKIKRLEDYSVTELQELSAQPGGADQLRAMREEAFQRRAAKMRATTALREWASQMTARHGPKVRVHQCELGWIAALAVVRYSEDPGFWPTFFNEKDEHRAKEWMAGQGPFGVTYIVTEG